MSSYQMFLASSINEFKDHRNEIGDLMRKVQNVLIDDGIKIKLFECEFFDNSMADTRKQEEYNDELKKSDVFIMLVGKKLGQYTLEEYDLALASDILHMYVLFDDVSYDESVASFKEQLDPRVKTFVFKTQKQLNYDIMIIIKELLKDKMEVRLEEEGCYMDKEYIKF